MRKCFFLLLIMAACTIANAQDYKKSPTFGIHLILNDFKTAAQIRSDGLANVLNSKQWSNTKRMVAGLGVSYINGINEHVDYAISLSGSYVDYPIPNSVSDGQQNLLLEAVATANLKLISDKYIVVPFLTGGIGASKYKGYYGALIPIGVGLQIKVIEGTYILLNSQYRIPASNTTVAYHFYHSFGVGVSFKKKSAEPAAEVTLPSGS
ncbi:MAG: hypothetical protein ABIY51_03460 [Ferruginibacter sp.]